MSRHRRAAGYDPETPIAIAIARMNGLTQATVATGIPTGTLNRWRQLGKVGDPEAPFIIEDKSGVSARALATGQWEGGRPGDHAAAPVRGAAVRRQAATSRDSGAETGSPRPSTESRRRSPFRC
jgi:hypothetical protein